MARYKIVYDRNGCIGAGACAAVSKNWKMNDLDNKADFLEAEFSEEDLEHNLDAARMCPVQVIKIINTETGEEVPLE
ncbi:ferredoxin [Candidatus Woesearchaeota archaeon]|nr:MAG: ferredoxin [Candidatus Woesearchaeota archaeon]